MTALIAARGRAAKASRAGRGLWPERRIIVRSALRISAMIFGAEPERTRELKDRCSREVIYAIIRLPAPSSIRPPCCNSPAITGRSKTTCSTSAT